MVTGTVAFFREFRMKRKYEILLVSFLILIFGDVLFPAGMDAMSDVHNQDNDRK